MQIEKLKAINTQLEFSLEQKYNEMLAVKE
jgi:hypothetical protein